MPTAIISCVVDKELVTRLDALAKQAGWFRSAMMARMLQKEIKEAEDDLLKEVPRRTT